MNQKQIKAVLKKELKELKNTISCFKAGKDILRLLKIGEKTPTYKMHKIVTDIFSECEIRFIIHQVLNIQKLLKSNRAISFGIFTKENAYSTSMLTDIPFAYYFHYSFIEEGEKIIGWGEKTDVLSVYFPDLDITTNRNFENLSEDWEGVINFYNATTQTYTRQSVSGLHRFHLQNCPKTNRFFAVYKEQEFFDNFKIPQ